MARLNAYLVLTGRRKDARNYRDDDYQRVIQFIEKRYGISESAVEWQISDNHDDFFTRNLYMLRITWIMRPRDGTRSPSEDGTFTLLPLHPLLSRMLQHGEREGEGS